MKTGDVVSEKPFVMINERSEKGPVGFLKDSDVFAQKRIQFRQIRVACSSLCDNGDQFTFHNTLGIRHITVSCRSKKFTRLVGGIIAHAVPQGSPAMFYGIVSILSYLVTGIGQYLFSPLSLRLGFSTTPPLSVY